jgi:hypothetical protein
LVQEVVTSSLQAQVSALELKLQAQLPERARLTIARMIREDKVRATALAATLGMATDFVCEADKVPKAEGHVAEIHNAQVVSHLTIAGPKRKGGGAATKASKPERKDRNSKRVHEFRIPKPTRKGTRVIETPDIKNVRVGMKVRIGAGGSQEERFVVELGSLILDSALVHDHQEGELVIIFTLTPQAVSSNATSISVY